MTTPTSRDACGRRPFLTALALALVTACAQRQPPELDVSQPIERKTDVNEKILIAMTSHDQKGNTGEKTGAYLPEIAHPYAVFTNAGYRVEFASVRGGAVPLDGLDQKDPVSVAFLADEAVMGRLHSSAPSRGVNPAEYTAIFFAGGHGAMWDLPDDAAFAKATGAIYERGGIVGAVCHGPAALVNVRLANGAFLVADKQLSAFTNEEERAVKLDAVVPFLLEDRLTARGARIVKAPNWQERVVTSERLVTGQNPASASGVAKAMVTLLQSSRAR